MDAFDCTSAGRAIADYVDELSNWYVRLSRRRFWEGDRAAFATLRHCLLETAELLAPFTPFIADEIHGNLTAARTMTSVELPDSVHLRDFPEPDDSLVDEPSSRRRWRPSVGRSSSVARHARRPRSRSASRCAGRSIVANEAERAAISSGSPRSSPRSSTSRSWSSSARSPSS